MPQKIPREQIVGEFWSAEAARRAGEAGGPLVDWTMSPTVQRMINRRVSGSPDVDWLEWLRRSYCPEGMGPVLSIGCGAGGLERELLRREMCLSAVGLDIAEGALAAASGAAVGLDVTYLKVDIENEELPPGPFDAVFAVAILHHVSRLGHVAGKLHGALKTGGHLFVLEYVGPSRFQWSESQLRLVGDIYSMLPWDHRFHFQAGGTVAYPARTPPCSMIRSDPSEAVRSDEIEGVLGRYFEFVEERDIGGTLLNPLLGGILESFEESSGYDGRFIEEVGLFEEQLVEAGVLPSDFKVIVYRKADAGIHVEELTREDEERVRTISGQERMIAGLHQRFLDLEERCELLRGRISSAEAEAAEEGARVWRQVRDNAVLKRGTGFALARAARGGEPTDEDGSTAAAPQRAPVAVPAVFGGGDEMASPLARAAKRYALALRGRGGALWPVWLDEMLGAGAGVLLTGGLEPWQEEAVERLGPVDRRPAGARAYDTVVLGPHAEAGTARDARDRLRPGGRLVAVDCEPEVREEEFFVEGRLAMTASSTAKAAEVLEGARGGREAQALALAGLIVYLESVRAAAGMARPAVRVTVFRRGEGARDGGEPGEARDVSLLQEAEIDRLGRGVRHREDVVRGLEAALEEARSRLEGARLQARRLATEREILQRRGALMYWRLFRLKRPGRARRGHGEAGGRR